MNHDAKPKLDSTHEGIGTRPIRGPWVVLWMVLFVGAVIGAISYLATSRSGGGKVVVIKPGASSAESK